MNNKLKFIDVEGDAHTRGVQIGRATMLQIEHSLSVYKQTFEQCNISWDQAKEKATRYQSLIESTYPTLLEELEGIAQGSGYETSDLFTLNCRTEILPPDFLAKALANSDQSPPDGGDLNECTSFAFNRANDKPVWLSQNWDWIGLQRQALVVVRAKTPSGNQFITVTEAGMLAKIGLNQHGFGMCLNILRSFDDGNQTGLPVHFLLRGLLECETVEQAKALVNSTQFASSSNVLIADKSGDMTSLELSPNGVQALPASETGLCHTNHFIHPTLAKTDAADTDNLSTISRLKTAQSKLSALNGLDDITRLLSDTSNGLESICRFPDTTLPTIAQIETVVGVVMNLSSMELWVSDAQPSASEFRHYSL